MATAALNLTVLDREKVIYEGQVKSLTSVNRQGEFDVLQMHAHFISLIKEKLVVRMIDGQVQEIPLDHGIIKVNDDRIVVFIGLKEATLKEVKPL